MTGPMRMPKDSRSNRRRTGRMESAFPAPHRTAPCPRVEGARRRRRHARRSQQGPLGAVDAVDAPPPSAGVRRVGNLTRCGRASMSMSNPMSSRPTSPRSSSRDSIPRVSNAMATLPIETPGSPASRARSVDTDTPMRAAMSRCRIRRRRRASWIPPVRLPGRTPTPVFWVIIVRPDRALRKCRPYDSPFNRGGHG